ncbi:hypothetical protein [Allomuricauda sp. F6463D]|uniref:hypothetical protein n=1 Tax=Allomuricauda sp. F6463D TaxID=2926409 RepID=UPI001FF33E25|nr:hypothetical protein [Muricauda sp. F6463D]MCK0160660.1 hypothetical protein [Muricauda sp. F6463D]
MSKLNTKQKVILAMGALGIMIGIYGKFNTWEYMEYFPFFYSGATLMWIAFLPNKKSCYNPFKKKEVQKS